MLIMLGLFLQLFLYRLVSIGYETLVYIIIVTESTKTGYRQVLRKAGLNI